MKDESPSPRGSSRPMPKLNSCFLLQKPMDWNSGYGWIWVIQIFTDSSVFSFRFFPSTEFKILLPANRKLAGLWVLLQVCAEKRYFATCTCFVLGPRVPSSTTKSMHWLLAGKSILFERKHPQKPMDVAILAKEWGDRTMSPHNLSKLLS